MAKPAKQEEARKLRREGKAVREIAEEIGCSKGSVSRWVRDVQLTKSQQKYLDSLNPAKNKALRGLGGASEANRVVWYERRRQYQEEGRELARKGDRDFIAGIMLYWAEGARSKNRNAVRLSNTSIPLMRFFLSFLKKYFNVDYCDVALSIHCRLNNGLTLTEIQSYWLKELNLQKANLRKAYIEQKRKVTGYRKNIHPYGVCLLTVNNTQMIQQIYGAIQEYIGFSEPKWIQ